MKTFFDTSEGTIIHVRFDHITNSGKKVYSVIYKVDDCHYGHLLTDYRVDLYAKLHKCMFRKSLLKTKLTPTLNRYLVDVELIE